MRVEAVEVGPAVVSAAAVVVRVGFVQAVVGARALRSVRPRDRHVHPRGRHVHPRDRHVRPRDRHVQPRDRRRGPPRDRPCRDRHDRRQGCGAEGAPVPRLVPSLVVLDRAVRDGRVRDRALALPRVLLRNVPRLPGHGPRAVLRRGLQRILPGEGLVRRALVSNRYGPPVEPPGVRRARGRRMETAEAVASDASSEATRGVRLPGQAPRGLYRDVAPRPRFTVVEQRRHQRRTRHSLDLRKRSDV